MASTAQLQDKTGEAGTLVKAGTGVLILSGSNSHTGGVTLNAGALALSNNFALGTGALTINGGSVGSAGGTRTLANNLVLNTDLTVNSGGTFNVSGNVDLAGGTRVIKQNGANATYSGVISNGGLSISNSGSGIDTILSGANTYSGATTVRLGVLNLSGSGSLSNSAVNLTGGGSSALSITNVTTSTEIGSLAGNASSKVDLGAKTLIVGRDNTSTTFAGAMSNTGSLVKTGSGTMTLSGSNTYSGSTTVSGGSLIVIRTNLTATITPTNISVAFSNTPATSTPYTFLTGSLAGGPYSTVTVSSPSGYNGTVDTNSGTISVTAASSANQKPVITPGQSFSISENSASGTVVGSLVATDADSNPLSGWAITAGNNSGAFALNSSTGQLSVLGSLNYEAISSYTLTVTVSDGTTTSDPVNVTVNVLNVAEFSDVFGSSDPSADDNGDGISNLLAYALGATTANSSVARPEVGMDSNKLTLTALVRTNDPKVQVWGNASTALSNWPTNTFAGTPAMDQTGAVSGVTQKQSFSVERGSDTKKFLRLKATLQP